MNVPARQQEHREAATLPSGSSRYFDLQSFELMQRVARGFSASSLVPKMYQGNTPEAIGNCMIALNLAERTRADPLMVMQNLTIVQGRPSWSSQFLIASVNTCGRFTALRFEFFGERGADDYGCRAWATEKSTGEKLVGADVTIELARKEGWYGRNGSKWQTMAQQMLMYRSGAWWTRVYAPELSMGLMTEDEAEDVFTLEPSAYQEVARQKPQLHPRAIHVDAIVEEAPANDCDPDEATASSAPQTPAEPLPAGALASSSTPPAGDEASILDLVEAARQAGRAACRRGDGFDNVPAKIARYIKHKAAWEDGFQQEGERMEAEARQ